MEIIADFCSNWKNFDNTFKMFDECRKIGIKYVKFQLFKKDQVPEEFKQYSLNFGQAKNIYKSALDWKLIPFFTPCYPAAVEFCEKLEVPLYKIRFVDRENLDIQHPIAKTMKPTIISRNEYYFNFPRHWDQIFCIPQYPAIGKGYDRQYTNWEGISDHTKDTQLLKYIKRAYPKMKWFEMHVCLDNNCLEAKWSKTLKEVGDALSS